MLITHARVFTFGDEPHYIADGAILIEGEQIAAVGESAALEQAHPQAQRLEPLRSFSVVALALPGVMTFAVHLQGELQCGAVEIEHVGIDSVLPSEFESRDLPASQQIPQDGFGGA